MKIGYDGKRAVLNMTGLGNYSRTLIHSLAMRNPGDEFLLFTPEWRENPRLAFLRDLSNTRTILPSGLYRGIFKGLWRSFGVRGAIKREHVDLFHGLSNELPIGLNRLRCARVVTIHDLIFLRYPQYYAAVDRKIYLRKSEYACSAADIVVAVSEQTKRDIVEFLGTDQSKIRVIYQSCDPTFSKSAGEQEKTIVRSRYNLPSQFVLYVGSIEERKNLLSLVQAIGSLRKSHDLFLVAIGAGTAYREKVLSFIQENVLTDRVQLRSDIAFSDFPAIYQMAQAFVYPSFFEGFGIPIIEALWSKTPVITSAGGCFPEAGGPGSLYVNPESSAEIAAALVRVLGDSTLRAKMIASGLSHVQKFKEEALSTQMMSLYQSLINR